MGPNAAFGIRFSSLGKLYMDLWTVQPIFALLHPKQSIPKSQSRRALPNFTSRFIKDAKKLWWYWWHLWNIEASSIGERIWHTRFPIPMEAKNSKGNPGRHGMDSWCTAWIRMWRLWCYHGPSYFLFGCIGYHQGWIVHWSWWRGCQQVNLYILCIHELWIYQLESLKAEEQLVSPQRQRFMLCG